MLCPCTRVTVPNHHLPFDTYLIQMDLRSRSMCSETNIYNGILKKNFDICRLVALPAYVGIT